jgi:hyperosmotically inducible periplasmic protein
MNMMTKPSFTQSLIISILLATSISACSTTSKTAESAPGSTDKTGQTAPAGEIKTNKDDAQSDIRKKQLESDIRAREQRNQVGGNTDKRAATDLASEVRSKLEANIPKSKLTVEANDNAAVTIAGSVTSKDQLSKIEPLAKQIKGVKSVIVKAVVAQ